MGREAGFEDSFERALADSASRVLNLQRQRFPARFGLGSRRPISIRPPAGMASAAFFTRFTRTRIRSVAVRPHRTLAALDVHVSAIAGPARAESKLRLATSSWDRLLTGSKKITSRTGFRPACAPAPQCLPPLRKMRRFSDDGLNLVRFTRTWRQR